MLGKLNLPWIDHVPTLKEMMHDISKVSKAYGKSNLEFHQNRRDSGPQYPVGLDENSRGLHLEPSSLPSLQAQSQYQRDSIEHPVDSYGAPYRDSYAAPSDPYTTYSEPIYYEEHHEVNNVKTTLKHFLPWVLLAIGVLGALVLLGLLAPSIRHRLQEIREETHHHEKNHDPHPHGQHHNFAFGPPGPPGSPGPTGPAGLPGNTGSPGIPGIPGRVGSSGSPGTPGISGLSGASGNPGIAGAAGTPGSAGGSGTPGIPGAAGAAGVGGLGGPVGPAGVAGNPGPAGPGGPAGIPGTPGADGGAGVAGSSGSPGSPGNPGQPGPVGPQGGSGAAGAPGGPGAPGPAGK